MDDIKPPSHEKNRTAHTNRRSTLQITRAQRSMDRTSVSSKQTHDATTPLNNAVPGTNKKMKKRKFNPFGKHKRISVKKFATSLSLIFIAIISTFYFVSEGAQAAVTVDTSTAASGVATKFSYQRKTWHDGTRYWMAFYSGTAIEFWYSADGTSWSQNTSATLAVATNDFSIEADSSNMFIAYTNSSNIYVRKASSYPGNSFTLGTEYAACDGPSAACRDLHITRDSDSKLVVTYELADVEYNYYYVKSINSNDPSSWSSSTHIGVDPFGTNIEPVSSALAEANLISTVKQNGNTTSKTNNSTILLDFEPESLIGNTSSDEAYAVGNLPALKFKKYTDKQGGDGVNINDASDAALYATNYSNPNGLSTARDSNGNIYTLIGSLTDGKCHLWKSTNNGSSWTELDSANAPGGSGNECKPYNIAIDSNDSVHLLYGYYDIDGTNVMYNTLSSGLYGTQTLVFINAQTNRGKLALDSNNVPHIVLFDYTIGPPGGIYYRNKVGGSWNTTVTIETGTVGNFYAITISEDNIPEIVYINTTDADLTAAVGNANNATSFTLQDVDTNVQTTAGTAGASIGIDASGNTWVAYIDENGASDYVTLVIHNDADAWSTWQTPLTNSKVGKEPTLAISENTIYVGYQNSTDDVALLTYNGTWTTENILKAGTFSDVTFRWANNHNYQHGPLDLVYSDSTDIFYSNTGYWQNSVTIESGGSASYATISRNTSDGKLYAFWIRSNTIYYSSASSPFTTWSAPSSLYATGTNVWLTSSASDNSTCSISYVWTSGAGSPYDVKFDSLTPCVSPFAPTLISPTNSSTNVATSPSFQLSSTDPQSDTIKYKINIHNTTATSGGNCSGSVFETADQNSSGTGWDNGTTAYASGATATYTIQTPLSASTGYCWQAQGKDPSGSNAFGPLSSAYTFTTSSVPSAPTLSQPANGLTGASLTPEFRMGTSDSDGDTYARYKIEVCSTSNCSSIVRTIDQTSSQTGWIGQSQQSATAYALATSIIEYGIHTYQAPTLSANTQYWWRAYAVDPGGSNSWSSASSIWSFTTQTSATPNQVIIKGNTNIGGNVKISP